VERIDIGLSSWIIQDGNYEDFVVGEARRFALEFYAPEGLNRKDVGDPSLHELELDTYSAVGRAVFVAPEVWVLDFGILVYREERPPKQGSIGALFAGRVHIGIDPFFYTEYLRDVPGMPNLYYDFMIDEILLETTPWEFSGRVQKRRVGDRSFVSVSRSDAWNHDGGNADYVLRCRVLRSAA